MRRTLTIIASVIVVVGIAALIYFLFFTGNGGLSVNNGLPANPFPTSGSAQDAGSASDAGNDAGGDTGVQIAPRLVKITSKPVANGFVVLDATTTPVVSLASTTDASSTPALTPSYTVETRYIDRESGNMYAYRAADGTSARLTNHTAPGVEEASWLSDGSLAYLRFLTSDTDKSEHIDTYALPADGSDGYFLARDLGAVRTEGSKDIFTFMPSTSGSVGTIEKPDGSGAATVFSSPLAALHLAFSGADLLAYTKPSASLPGYAFLINRATGGFSTVLGPLSGLAVLANHAGTEALYSFVANGSESLTLFDMKSRVSTALPVATFAEKCAWAPDDTSAYCAVPASLTSPTLPDGWYQGVVHTSDRIWKIDLSAHVATLVADLQALSNAAIDAQGLALDPYGSTLVFMNKVDDSLWAYSLQ